MPETGLAHTRRAEKALWRRAKSLLASGEVSTLEDGLRVACTTLDGAGDDPLGTVESIQTCRNLFGEEVVGMTTTDTVTKRKDELAGTERPRRRAADRGSDAAEKWLKKHDPEYEESKAGWGR